MSDEATRALERRWRETGAAEDEARWLRARVRAGELRPDALTLAAWCGHRAAIAALAGDAPVHSPSDLVALAAWLSTIGEWGAEARVVAAVAAAELAAARTIDDRGDRAHDALARAREWTLHPCIEHALGSLRAADLVPFGSSSQKDQVARQAVRAAALAPLDPSKTDEAVRQAVVAVGSESAVRAKVEQTLAVWALAERPTRASAT